MLSRATPCCRFAPASRSLREGNVFAFTPSSSSGKFLILSHRGRRGLYCSVSAPIAVWCGFETRPYVAFPGRTKVPSRMRGDTNLLGAAPGTPCTASPSLREGDVSLHAQKHFRDLRL